MSVLLSYKDDEMYFHHSLDTTPDPSEFFMHAHDMYELFFFVSGKGIYHIEGSSYSLTPGDVLVMQRAESHYIEIDPSCPYERVVVQFNESVLSGLDRDGILFAPFNKRIPGRMNLYRREDFKNTHANFYVDRLRSSPPATRLHVTSLLVSFLLELHRVFLGRHDEDTPPESTTAAKIINYINLHLFDKLTLDDISNAVYISKPQICRVFKKATGSSVGEYVTAKRLLHAQEMLRKGIPATSVCASCGFADYSSFYRSYIKHFGVSPATTLRGS